MILKYEKQKIVNEIKTTKLSKNDLPKLASFINSMRNISSGSENIRSTSSEYYNWIYFQNPVGKAYAYKSVHNGKIISSFAIIPKRFIIQGKEYIIGKTMDMFTHPDYQGLGIIKAPMKKSIKAARDDGIKYWYTTPSSISYPIFKNKFKYIEPVNTICSACVIKVSNILQYKFSFFRYLKYLLFIFDSILSIFHRVYYHSYSHYLVKESFNNQNEIDELFKNFNDFKMIQIRDEKYFWWRYHLNPDNYIIKYFYDNNRLVGIMVLKKTLRKNILFGEIVDYMYDKKDKKILKSMLNYSNNYFLDSNCSIIQAWVMPKTEIEKKFRNRLFIIKRYAVKILMNFESKVHEIDSDNCWFLTQGDGNDI